MEQIDARGLACPRPVMEAKAALDRGAGELEVLVDNSVAASNVSRFLQKNAFSVTREEKDGTFVVSGCLEGSEAAEAESRSQAGEPTFEDVSILIAQKTLGGRDEVLGEVLIKGFLSTLADRDVPPRTVALMNEAVFLTLAEHSASDSLKKLEERGVNLLVCGTCTNHFGVTEGVRAGTVSNMFEITEALLETSRTVSLG